MTAKILKDVLERVETWPQEAQEELAAIALEMDAGLGGGVYHATPEELEGIDRGLKAARDDGLQAMRRSRRISRSTGAHEGHLYRRGAR
jgi:hypothetical protein